MNLTVDRSAASSASPRLRVRILLLLLLLVLLFTLPLPAQDRHPISGRRYAAVMGSAGADWLVRPERESEEQPGRALDLIGIAKNSTVADVGAGNGYITWRLAERVGAKGKV